MMLKASPRTSRARLFVFTRLSYPLSQDVRTTLWSNSMDKNRTEGAKHQVKGTVREVAGKVTGNKSKEISGKIEKNVGKVQKNVGEASDEVRNAQKRQDEERRRKS